MHETSWRTLNEIIFRTLEAWNNERQNFFKYSFTENYITILLFLLSSDEIKCLSLERVFYLMSAAKISSTSRSFRSNKQTTSYEEYILSRHIAKQMRAISFVGRRKIARKKLDISNFKFKHKLRFQRPFNPHPFPSKVTISKLSRDLVDSILVPFEAQSPITRLKETDERTPRDFT